MKVLIVGNITSCNAEKRQESYSNAEALLHDIGVEVINPFASNKQEEIPELIMAGHVHLISGCDAILLLTDWNKCSCARLLKVIAEEFNKQVLYADQIKMTSKTTGLQKIKTAVEFVTGKKFDAFSEVGRVRNSLYIRMIISKYLATKCRMDAKAICGIINRDRSTVTYYLSKYESELQYNPEFRKLVAKFDVFLIKSVSA